MLESVRPHSIVERAEIRDYNVAAVPATIRGLEGLERPPRENACSRHSASSLARVMHDVGERGSGLQALRVGIAFLSSRILFEQVQ